jgi:exopolyphosphatase/guanosine-5'-triphosphate,3'-diphosphate pyrophosphatase
VGALAAVDCGSLSTRLLVKSREGKTLARLARITGLGKGVDGAGELGEEAIQRVLEVLREYREVMGRLGVSATTMVGTSALRDARNRAYFSEQAEAVVGTPLRLLSGHEEALLSFRGATAMLCPGTAPWLVADIGGGSTELVAGPRPLVATSLGLGCVRVTERFFAHDPPSASELQAARSWVAGELREACRGLPALVGARSLVGLAGTVLALACLDQGLSCYQGEAVHHYRLKAGRVEQLLSLLAGDPEAARSLRPGVEPARAPFIVGGTLVLATLMDCFGFSECLVSESDILDGLVAELAEVDGFDG